MCSSDLSKDIRALFQKDIVSVPHVMSYWNQLVDNVDCRKVWMISLKCLILNKVKVIIIRLSIKETNLKCCFCEDNSETVLHLFWHCLHTQAFWQNFRRFIIDHIFNDFVLMWENMVFCFYKNLRKEK